MRILLASPLRQKPHIFEEHVESVQNLWLPQGVELDTFYVVNNSPDCLPIIRREGLGYTVLNSDDEYRVTERTHIWTRENLAKMSSLRNVCITDALRGGYDALLFADTDLVLHEDTVAALLDSRKSICGEIFWTQAQNGEYWANAWHFDQSTLIAEEVAKWRKKGVYKVGGTGALMLIRREVLEAGVNYAPIPMIRDALVGEDRFFAIRAQVSGFGLWLDTHAPAKHLYTEAVYKTYMEGKNAHTC